MVPVAKTNRKTDHNLPFTNNVNIQVFEERRANKESNHLNFRQLLRIP